MGRLVSAPGIMCYPLAKWDPSGETTVTIREARAGEEAARAKLFSHRTIERTTIEGVIREIYEQSSAELAFLECWLTFVEASIEMEAEKSSERSMFKKGMSREAFERAFALLPIDLAVEWHERVIEHNPDWE